MPARQIALREIWFDTYENGKDVLKEHIQAFIDAVKFSEDRQRPPTYAFMWGDNAYFDYCFIEQVSYRLTKLLPDGKPVRAVIDALVLKETEKPSDDASEQQKPQPNPGQDNRQGRK